jgi:glycerol kinase
VPVACLPKTKPIYAEYGELAGTRAKITAVCGDQNAAFFGTGEVADDTALINLGSGAFILRPLKQYTSSNRQLTGIAFSDDNEVIYLREATVNGAGNALDWAVEKYNINNVKEQLPGWLREITNPPLFINTIGGLGSPWWQQTIEPEFITHDMNDNNEGARIVAIIESIVFMLRANLDLMADELPLRLLRVSGGLSNIDGLCQKLASLCNLPIERTKISEATARGVAWLAAGRPEQWGLSGSAAIDIFSPIPDKTLEQRYSQYLEILNNKM